MRWSRQPAQTTQLLRYSSFPTEASQNDYLKRGLPQHERPTFVPVFTSLRETCMERSKNRLRSLEAKIKNCVDGPEKNDLIDQAILELRDLDRQFDAITNEHQLGDPTYAKQRGLSLTYFSLKDGAKKGDWMLVSGSTGKHSASITETDQNKLTPTTREWLEEFCAGCGPPTIAFKRHKTLLEQQRGVITEHGKHLTPNPKTKKMWRILLAAGFAAEIVFLGVGLIAMTTTFSDIMMQYLFWICLIWLLASSSLLVLLVRALGASGKDCLSAFLAAVAIWLVVIQIGQTKLNGQRGVN